MNKQKNSHISYKKIIALSILFIVILGISVLAGNVKVNSVKIRFSNNHEITVLTSKTKVSEILEENNIRVELDDRDEKLSYKMRESQTKKIPFTLIIGDKEKQDNSISYRLFGSRDTVTLSKEEFVNKILDDIKRKA